MPLFPDPRTVRSDIIAIGDDLTPETLLEAYRHGIFPWPTDEMTLPWFSPRKRAILPFRSIHIPRSLERARRKNRFELSIDGDFEGVIRNCSEAERPGQDGTWIFPEVIAAYTTLHQLGYAHSAEAWLDGKLVGGIYGVDAGGVFCGESMYFHEPYASKIALLHLCDHLQQRGSDFLDIQVMTPHMEQLGAIEIPRSLFLDRLAEHQRRDLRLFP
jgi:leucyl/phenylalanyl-tRNA--protein transferase